MADASRPCRPGPVPGSAVQAAPGAGAPGTGQHLAQIAGKRVEVVAPGPQRPTGISTEIPDTRVVAVLWPGIAEDDGPSIMDISIQAGAHLPGTGKAR